MNTPHTPGPFHVEREGNQYIVCQGTTQGDGIRVAYVAPQPYASIEAANADLIAQAPELRAERDKLRVVLENLAIAVVKAGHEGTYPFAMRDAAAILAKTASHTTSKD